MSNKFDPTMRQSIRLPDELAKEAVELLRGYNNAAEEARCIRREAVRRIQQLDDAARRSAWIRWEKIAERMGLDAKATFGTGEWVLDARYWGEHRTIYLNQLVANEDAEDTGEALPTPPAVIN